MNTPGTGLELRDESGLDDAASALSVVSDELLLTIRNAHQSLEDCVDGSGGTAALTRTGELLHQVSGALKMAEAYGAALLADEMEAVCSYLAELVSDRGREDGLEALTRSMVQLPIYIDRLLSGGRDIALVLLPILNDLRASRGQPLLSESTLLLLNLSPTRKSAGLAGREPSGEDPVQVATRLRPKFQLALLGWIKGTDAERHLGTLSHVAAAMEKSATRDDMFQLWWVVGGVLESLQNGGLETSVSLKRLLGQADRQLKYLIDEGVDAIETHPVTDLLNNLLYYVARSSNAGQRISEIRAAFNLSELLPGDEQVEHARESLAAPSVKLMETVAAAIREDLGRVKDVLDIYVRTGMEKSSDLVPQLDLLKKISDTLGVLGLGELRGDIDSEIDRLKQVVEQGGATDQKTIIDIASTLLKVEDRLDRQLVQLVAPVEAQPTPSTTGAPDAEDADYRKVAEAVMRECIINLARVKETFSQSLASSSSSQGLDSMPALIRGIKAGLMMLNKSRAMDVVERIGELITVTLKGGGPSRLTQKETDRLADAIVSVEYYMETVKAGRKEPSYMLDNAEACLAVLNDLETRLATEEIEPPPADRTMRIEAPEFAATVAIDRPSPPTYQATEVMPAPVVAQTDVHIDPEMLELFIEEAKEEIVSIRRNLPRWVESSEDVETLITVRRSFHTLKGSGRMVGAERIAEFSWSIENLLNRLINRTLTRTPPMVEFITEAAAALPELIEQLEVGTEPATDIAHIMTRAHAFAEGDPNAAVLEAAAQAPAEEPAEAAGLEMDPVLLDIFAKETAGHLKVISDYVDSCAGHQPPFPVTDKLYRACHTLHGSANMANVERGVAVAGALNRFVRRVHDCKTGFQPSGIGALTAVIKAITTIVNDINRTGQQRSDFAVLIDHVNNLTDSVEPAPAKEIVVPPPAAPEKPQPAVSEAAEPEYDVEIAAIFSEEAAELLEAADHALASWCSDKSARQYIEELKRHLHTLKGGARMSGIVAMGNLSHELEALLINIDDGRISSNEQIEKLLQESIDELHRMRDTVIAGKNVVPAARLVQNIQAINQGHGQPSFAVPPVAPPTSPTEQAPVVAEESVSVEFTAEPEDTVSMVILDSPLGEEGAEVAAAEEPQAPPPGETPPPIEPELTSAPPADELPPPIEPELTSAPPADYLLPPIEPELTSAPPADELLPPIEPELTSAPPADELPPPIEPELTTAPPADELPPQLPETAPASPPAIDAPARPDVPERAAAAASAAAEPRTAPPRDVESRQEFTRIDAELLEDLLNAAGEVSIYHARLGQQVNKIEFHVDELEQTVARLREQLRKLEIETEAQIMHGHQETMVAQDFDPLELDRYSNIQQLSRALAESANDMGSLKDLLQSVTSEAESLLVQQARVTAELQDGLMRTRMVPFQKHVPRLTRLVRQAASEVGKRVELRVEGASGELDRQVLDKMLPPFEHMMRNAVVHGIEDPETRQAAGKPANGRITIRLHREGAEMVIDIADDGAGLDVNAIRAKAFEKGLLQADSELRDQEIMQLILTPGFSTASAVTQAAGRGVGMDVVANEIKQLGGSLQISSVTGQGTNFTIKLPFTLAITQALIVGCGDEVYALPLPTVEGVARIARNELETLLKADDPTYQYGEESYRFRHLGLYVGGQPTKFPEDESFVPVILVRAGEHSAALLADRMIASQEIVVKSIGPQLSSISGISGATILGDGRIVLILDINALVRQGAPVVELQHTAPAASDEGPLALVVDDSITVRRVMERFLDRNGMRVLTARDGLDAIRVMQDNKPDIILLDIEMPNMDGYEFASHVRNDERVSDVPIIMITSRVGDKHRARAIEIGVDDYLGKPYQDSELLQAIRRLLDDRGIALA
jgi:chemosensory pili system protein ChpA (sensor histidine kinase/response regulator)